MRLIQLTDALGKDMWLNPKMVVSVRPYASPDWPRAQTLVEVVNDDCEYVREEAATVIRMIENFGDEQ